MSSKDSIIMLASVGTTVIRAKVITYDKIREELADYSGMEVLQAFRIPTDEGVLSAITGELRSTASTS